jgi:hypothetical protein
VGVQKETTVETEAVVFSPADPTIPYRLVGSYEYANAVYDLQRLIEQSSIDEIRVYNEILKTHPEFSLYAGMEVQGKMPRDWKPEDASDVARYDSLYKKRGLAWMLALAKVELGATLAAYTDSKTPFLTFAPTLFDREEFTQILLEDCIDHVQALNKESIFKKVMKMRGSANNETLAYLRRIKLIRDMMDVLKQSEMPGLAAKIRPVEKDLERSQHALVTHVKSSTGQRQHISATTSQAEGQMTADSVAACEQLVGSLEK